jgi:hypothetical protein
MNYFQEYALLIAVAIPCLAIVGINVYLWGNGERGTLLLPSAENFKTMAMGEEVQEEQPVGYEAAPVAIAAEPALTAAEPANDVHVREAA